MILGLSRMNLESFNSFGVWMVSLPLLISCLARFLIGSISPRHALSGQNAHFWAKQLISSSSTPMYLKNRN
ncbi:hypothetical protein RchiOBHm_Chr3g0497621 [Rosa chinensis]|uniref:Uncharacterized protein n=1 Tax=Rosa chinensis TaxID=74649 RepID=A0A2P6RHR5_ROSCH|nr:hypothetical protein RchiOBHm_Chr3g0497621 [Rosa chinensis]